MISKLDVFSCKRTSKSRAMPLLRTTSRNSMLKMRLGAGPDTEVNIPCPSALSVSSRSDQYGAIRWVITAVGRGQSLMGVSLLLVNCRLPLDETLAEVKV